MSKSYNTLCIFLLLLFNTGIMMLRLLLGVLLVSCFHVQNLNAQGVHFTYFQFAPQSVNPAQIGAFQGTYRAFGIFRDQFQGGGVNGYRTFEVSVDAPIINGFRKQDWIGVGLSMNVDSRGVLRLRDTYSRIGASYHFSLDKKQTSVLTLGGQLMSISRRFNSADVRGVTRFQLENSALDPTDPDIINFQNAGGGGGMSGDQNPQASFSDWVGGITYTNKSKNSNFTIGFALSSFLNANAAFRGFEDLPARYSAFGQYVVKINKTMTIEPAFFTQFRRDASEVTANTLVGIKIKEESDTVLKLGLGARTGTLSGQFLAGLEHNGWKAGFSFDLPVDGYSKAPGLDNAFEICIGYLGIIKKKPKLTPVMVCPRL
jgi:type IX secretion system PorP/SprF family membrane protein